MMQFRTPCHVSKNSHLDYNSNVLLIGSCFTENIGAKLNYYKFNTLQNPFGILFHPMAIRYAIDQIISNDWVKAEELICYNDLWLSLNHHSCFNHEDQTTVLKRINLQIEKAHLYLKKSTHLIITLGTAWTYKYQDTNQFVANCHKIPQINFTKTILEVAEIYNCLHEMILNLKAFNPDLRILFTVSPVRHLKDGMIENTRSKSHLLTAIHQLSSKNVQYFPSYEIMMDDLRDYRFYKKDMIHPNDTAIDYIWHLFRESFFAEETQAIMTEVDQIQKGLNHKPSHQNSKQHQLFEKKLQKKIEDLSQRQPSIQF